MRVLVIQHSAADSLAAAESVISTLGHEVITIRVDRQQPIPTSVDCDAMITLGGPYPLTMKHRPNWVTEEQTLVRKYVERDRRILGICLGAQIVASALGSPIRRNDQAELGWHDVHRTSGESKMVDRSLPSRMTVFHWHRDTFGMPEHAAHLYKSETCHHQAFGIEDRIFGFQFHLESDMRTIQTFLAVSQYRKLAGKGVQTKSQILSGIAQYLSDQMKHMNSFLTQLLPRD